MLKLYAALSHALGRLKENVEGASLVEYALVVALVAAVVIGALDRLSNDIGNAFNVVGDEIRNAASSDSGGDSGGGSDDPLCEAIPCPT